ncbi:hypothetical protein PISMIDRAFT_342506 [Pisolithus microcarpus 441]|uniref:Uncharacterized protein n=1 Tax=Pisolithus microcarpus 441 TaxID=765257 RepID=A0A0C9YE72_9AGAM|nr:hypothetical protein PISMIDRAFT_342506 [Pisolithus microcarpus 441]
MLYPLECGSAAVISMVKFVVRMRPRVPGVSTRTHVQLHRDQLDKCRAVGHRKVSDRNAREHAHKRSSTQLFSKHNPIVLVHVYFYERTEHRLRIIAAANITTHYGISAASLSPFRQVIVGKDVKEDPTIIEDFRRVVPVTDYESYSPFVAKFFSYPRKQSELQNLLAPGLPSFIGISSSTTRNKSKLFAKYSRGWSNTPPSFAKLLQSAESEKTAYTYCFGYRELLEVIGEDGEVMKKIPVCIGTCGGVRDAENWSVETDSIRMGAISEAESLHVAQSGAADA